MGKRQLICGREGLCEDPSLLLRPASGTRELFPMSRRCPWGSNRCPSSFAKARAGDITCGDMVTPAPDRPIHVGCGAGALAGCTDLEC